MFDPESVKRYRLFHGDAVHVLLGFKPNSIHSGFATPGIMFSGSERIEPWQDFFGYRAQWFQILYETLRNDGSFFMGLSAFYSDDDVKRLTDMMYKIGWIKQYGTGFGDGEHSMHWTKSDNFYESIDNKPPRLVEDFESFRRKTNATLSLPYPVVESDCVDSILDRICSSYTPPDGITLEPTVGYGRHVIAALQRGRRVIGIDWNKMALTVCARRANMLTCGSLQVRWQQ